MFQTIESCIKLHAVVVLELLLSEQCLLLQVCVSTAPGVCVCPLLQVCVCVPTAPGVCACVCVCVCVCVSTAPGVCALGWVKCREHISLLVKLYYE